MVAMHELPNGRQERLTIGTGIGIGRPPIRPIELPKWHPRTSVRRLTDLPDPQSFVEPGFDGIFAMLAADPPGPPPDGLAPYVAYSSPNTPADPARYNIDHVVVKITEGATVAVSGAALAIAAPTPVSDGRRQRLGLASVMLKREVAEFNAVLAKWKAALGRSAPSLDATTLAALHRRAEQNSRVTLADPNLFVYVHTQSADPKSATALLTELRGLALVEAAYFQPIPMDAADIPPTTTIDVTPQQGYFHPAPTGVDVDLVRHLPGGLGDGVRIADVEAGWHTDHEDLPPVRFGHGVNFGFIDGEHGTAVLGELAAQMNTFGANGIAPNAAIGWSSVTNIDLLLPWNTYFYSVADAVLATGHFLRPGDIALIEQHFPNPFAGACTNGCNCGQFGYVAVETMPHEHAAISLATAAGVIVVEAAGNGQTMVTPASSSDSGAIVVGASNNDLTPACFTNFGPRVNVHAWGGGIGTLGFADMSVVRVNAAGMPVLDSSGRPIIDDVPDPSLRANGNDNRQFYTRGFGGTSGASPIVVGAAALIQSTRAQRGLVPLTPLEMRTLLVTTGTPQVPATVATAAIGPFPNLAAAVLTYVPDGATFVSETGAPVSISPGAAFSQSVTFRNSGGAAWTGVTLAIAQADNGSFPWGNQSVTLGSAAAPIMPGDEITQVFTLTAPTQPGSYILNYVLTSAAGVRLAFSPRQSIAVAAPNTGFDNGTVTIIQAPGSLKVGMASTVTVSIHNTGSTTWTTAAYGLQLLRTGRIALPLPSASLTGPVAPGQSQTITFTILAAPTPGLGGFSVQLSGPNGSFGTAAGQNVVCQP
jgi:hypothetical protein